VKRIAVAVLGGVLTLAGIVLLVLPGPGFVLIAVGLAVLATQFEWARRPLEEAKRRARQGMGEIRESRWRAAATELGALVLIGVGVLDLAGIDLPLVTWISDVLLVLSGLFLTGTVVVARQQAAGRRTPFDRATAYHPD
jgi:uncharacterized protein (TIGR02611 family)